MERTEEILELSKLEGDRLHIEVLRSKHDVLRSLEKPVDDRELERIREYETEAAVLSANIAREEMQVGIANEKHAIFALGVTLLSIAYAQRDVDHRESPGPVVRWNRPGKRRECPRVLGDLPLPVICLVNSHRLAPESHVHYISPASDSYVRPCGSSSGRPT